MEKITEIDMNKYFVLKIDDIEKYASDTSKKELTWVSSVIKEYRKAIGKKENTYLVLNLDDDIDWNYLTDWHNVVHPDYRKLKVSDIAVTLVNAILKTK